MQTPKQILMFKGLLKCRSRKSRWQLPIRQCWLHRALGGTNVQRYSRPSKRFCSFFPTTKFF